MAERQYDHSGRLRPELLERFVHYSIRVLKLVEKMEKDHRPRRVIDQITGSGTSPGAQMFEAHDAMSTADFLKSIGWTAKELNETLHWLRVIKGMAWEPPVRMDELIDETHQLISIVKAMNARTRRNRP